MSNINSRNVEEIVIQPEIRQGNIKLIKTSIIRWNTTKYQNFETIQLYRSL